MIVRDGWISTNIRQRLEHRNLDFSVSVKPTRARVMTFADATAEAATELGKVYPRIFLALSGGADSVYALMCFARAGVKVTPVIVTVAGNPVISHDTEYAHSACDTVGVAPITIELTEAEHLRRFYQEIYQPIGGCGVMGVASILTAKLAQERGGIAITGDGIVISNDRRCIKLGMNEWDVYPEALVGENILCPFFVYSPEIARSILVALPPDYGNAPTCLVKSRLYGHPYRPKTPGAYASPEVRDAARQITASLRTNVYGSLETRDQLLAKLA